MKSVARRLRTHKLRFGKIPTPEVIMEWWSEYPYIKPTKEIKTATSVVMDEDYRQAQLQLNYDYKKHEDRMLAIAQQQQGYRHGLAEGLLGALLGGALPGGALCQQTMAGHKHYCPYCRGL